MRLSLSLSRVGLCVITAAGHVMAANSGSFCGTLVCVSGTTSGSETIYTLNTTASFAKLGWMAVGFGRRMAGSSMVVMWANQDGSLVLSQREGADHSEPQVMPNPTRIATVRSDLSTLVGSAITFSFSMPSSGQTSEQMIYAFGKTKPNSNSVSATLEEHSAAGSFTLNMNNYIPDSSSSATVTGSATATTTATLAIPTQTGGGGSESFDIPYSTTEKKLLAHGILSALGFCFFLPIGVLQARFLRIWWPTWFKTHWIVQAGLAGPFIVAGFALAISVVQAPGARHFDDKHGTIGLVLFVLYAFQALYGLIIHLVKNPRRRRRPIQNYGHAILGLGVITLSLYQVWYGFNDEWSSSTGRDKPKQGLRTFWVVWVAILGAAYVIGLALLPKQYRAERYVARDGEKNMTTSDINVHPLDTHGA